VSALRDLTARIDAGLAKHFENEGVEYMQFSFRWVNCLLMREISIKNTIRMWDTYFVSFSSDVIHAHLQYQLTGTHLLVGRTGIFPIPLIRVRRISCKVVGPACKDELPGSSNVLASFADKRLDRKGH
jgi:hypothetical protein